MAKNLKGRWPPFLQFADALRDLQRAEAPHRSDGADWCATASSLASLAAYESGAPKIPEPEAPCDEDAGIADEVTEPVQPGAVLEHTSGPGSAEASSGNRNSSVTDSDWVASSEGDPPTTPSNPKVPPALGSATRPAAHRCCGRSSCSLSVWSPYSSRRKDANSPGLGVIPNSRPLPRQSQLWSRRRATSQNTCLPVPAIRQIPRRYIAQLRLKPSCRAISPRVRTPGRTYVRIQTPRRGIARTKGREPSSADR